MARFPHLLTLALSVTLTALMAGCGSTETSGGTGSDGALVGEPAAPLLSAQAVQSNQDFTAYAMGNLYGADSSQQLSPGGVAVHRVSGTTGTPVIPFGTLITLTNGSISIPDSTGTAVVRTQFRVRDLGDFQNVRSPYWVDVYFGRYRRSGDACSCPGVNNSQCVVASTNSCTNATNFGLRQYSYSY